MRRLGWSDVSLADAQSNADARVKDALERVLSGEKLARTDPKIPYNGAAGVPIREEIISRHGETIVTRNSYGARCLNTPNVLFADVDFPDRTPIQFTLFYGGVLILLVAVIAWITQSPGTAIALSLFALLLVITTSKAAFRLIQAARGGAEQTARRRVVHFLASRPDWNLRLYRTPAGMRIAATHKLFSPSEPAVAEFFTALATDPIYATMCRNQQCFRARVSAKPWRMGIQMHLRPRPGVWPVSADRLPHRNAWIEDYEKAARAYSACSFIESLGSDVTHMDARPVIALHDQLCRATINLPIA